MGIFNKDSNFFGGNRLETTYQVSRGRLSELPGRPVLRQFLALAPAQAWPVHLGAGDLLGKACGLTGALNER